MTIPQIVAAVSAKKPVSKRTVFRYVDELGIAPLGARQWNQPYPDDTAERILQHLGFSSGADRTLTAEAKRESKPATFRSAGILTLKQLKKHQPKRSK